MQDQGPPRPHYLFVNHSTSKLIPNNRKEIFQQKRHALQKKLNRIADNVYKLKYDQAYDHQQLAKLTREANSITVQIERKRDDTKMYVEKMAAETSRLFAIEPIVFAKIGGKTGQFSDRSTEAGALTDRSNAGQSEYKEITQQVAKTEQKTKISVVRREQRSSKKQEKQFSEQKSILLKRNARIFQGTIGSVPKANLCLFVLLLVFVLALL